MIQDGVNGMLADTQEQWIDKLELLISSPKLRRDIGHHAIETVRAQRSLTGVFQRLEQNLLTLINSPVRKKSSFWSWR
jgi:hypothetical protein